MTRPFANGDAVPAAVQEALAWYNVRTHENRTRVGAWPLHWPDAEGGGEAWCASYPHIWRAVDAHTMTKPFDVGRYSVRRPSITIAEVDDTNAPLGNPTRQRSVSTLRIDRHCSPSRVSGAVPLFVRFLREDLRSERQSRGATARVEQTRRTRQWDGLVRARVASKQIGSRFSAMTAALPRHSCIDTGYANEAPAVMDSSP